MCFVSPVGRSALQEEKLVYFQERSMSLILEDTCYLLVNYPAFFPKTSEIMFTYFPS